jgi:hypothetical protein
MRQNGSTQQYVSTGETQTIGGNKTFSNATNTFGSSTATGTIGLATGATLSGSTKTVNIATAGVSGSTTLTTIGPVAGASTTTIGATTAASTLNLATGATLTATTKAVNIGTAGAAGSTTNIVIGSTTGTSTTTLQGSTVGVTLAADNNTTGLATTAFVVGQAGSATPLVNGTAAVGTSLRYARQDHVHPTDTSRAALASPTFTGTPAAPTAAVDTNTTQLATTAFVVAQAAAATPLVNGTAAVGTSTRYARADHVHPTDTTRAPLASPAFTGTPSLPTGTTAVTQTAGNNTTAVATTAFVTAAVPVAATVAEAKAGTDTAKFISANVLQKVVNSPSYYKFPRGIMSTAVSGTASYVTAGALHTLLGGTSSGAGGAIHRYNGPSSVDIGSGTGWAIGTGYGINFGKQIRLTGSTRMLLGANNIVRVSYGKNGTSGVGDPTQPSIGWRYNLTTGFIEIVVHNGTTLTTLTTASNPFPGFFEWEIYSNGAGSVQMFVNDVSIGTTTGGPTSLASSNTPSYVEEIESTSSNTIASGVYFRNGGLFLQP